VRRASLAFAALAGGLALRCGGRAAAPSDVDSRNDACAFCRMPVSNPKLAAQLAAPGEEPRFFDDIGCLRDYAAGTPKLPARAAAYVADYRTGRWVAASSASYERCAAIETPMGSHLIAHAAGSNATAGCEPRTAADVFGAAGPPPGGAR
jgi:copper chaperone NosL